MNIETARILLDAIAAVGATVWLCGLVFLIATSRMDRAAHDEDTGSVRFAAEDRLHSPSSGIRGTAELSSPIEGLSERLASALAKGPSTGFLVKILDQTDDRITFDLLGFGAGGMPVVPWHRPRRGEIRLAPLGVNRTRVDYVVEESGGRWMLWLGAAFQMAGLMALVAGYWACRTYLLPNPNPSYRVQVVQMVQTVHFLWPPFLFGALYRVRRRSLRTGFDTLVHNLPYV